TDSTYTLLPYTTLFRSRAGVCEHHRNKVIVAMREGALMYAAYGRKVSKGRGRPIANTGDGSDPQEPLRIKAVALNHLVCHAIRRSEEHTSELQSRGHLV